MLSISASKHFSKLMLSDSRRTTELNYTEAKSWPNNGAKLAYTDALPNYKNKTVLFFVFVFCYFQYGFFFLRWMLFFIFRRFLVFLSRTFLRHTFLLLFCFHTWNLRVYSSWIQFYDLLISAGFCGSFIFYIQKFVSARALAHSSFWLWPKKMNTKKYQERRTNMIIKIYVSVFFAFNGRFVCACCAKISTDVGFLGWVS